MRDKQNSIKILSYLALIVALIMHSMVYLINRSFYGDEIALARNLIERDLNGLFAVLDYNQAAPLGFLLVSEIITTIFGFSEYAFRLFPFMAGIGIAFLLFRIGKRFSSSAAIFLLIWYATSNMMLRYTSEFKQYIFDVFFSVFLVDITFQLIDQEIVDWRLWALWAVVGAIGVWFSHPVALVIAGIGISMILKYTFSKNWRGLLLVVAACAIAALSFLVVYFVPYQSAVGESELRAYMRDFWGGSFFSFTPVNTVRFVLALFQYTIGFEKPFIWGLMLYLFAFIIGIRQLKLSHISTLLLHMPFILILSSLRLYPLVQRFLLYLLPFMAIIVVVGFSNIFDNMYAKNKLIAFIFMFSVLGFMQWGATTEQGTYHIRETAAFIYEYDPSPQIYAGSRAGTGSEYYNVPHEELPNLQDFSASTDSEQLVWYIFGLVDRRVHPEIYAQVQAESDAMYIFAQTELHCFHSTTQVCP